MVLRKFQALDFCCEECTKLSNFVYKSLFIHFDSDLKQHRHDDGGDELEHPSRCQCQVSCNGPGAVTRLFQLTHVIDSLCLFFCHSRSDNLDAISYTSLQK
jgi:hypothetical protein